MTDPRFPELWLRFDADTRGLPPELAHRFVALAPDGGLRDYLDQAEQRRLGFWGTALQRWLRRLLSDFDVNGLLGAYPMHLLGTTQLEELLGRGERLLDIGAGSGDITAQLAPLFRELLTTEVSWGMARRLRARGFACERLDVTVAGIPQAPWEAISCFNVLDRCRRPLTLLRTIAGALTPKGRAILSLPLPYDPFYFAGPDTPPPEERLPLDGLALEAAVPVLAREVLPSAGLRLHSWARAPYLSGGDRRHAVYELDALVLVVEPALSVLDDPRVSS